MIDPHVLIAELQDIAKDSLLNKVQKERFIESTVLSALWLLEVDDVPALKALLRMSMYQGKWEIGRENA